ncbi:MAG TPA: hypothetical protein VFE33_14225 [Thermoanaerobaculia bacterium]|nr:hypothetical protein [Thermoanaerobaculia bacterium]
MTEERASSTWLLRTRPTLRRWDFEIREILRGHREDYVDHFGNGPGYIKSLLVNSRDPSTADYLFREALLHILDSWHPSASPNVGWDRRMLQFLATFTPSEGLGKALTLVKDLNELDNQTGDELDDERCKRVWQLKPVALQVLEQYFPVEHGPPGAFAEYVTQLETNLDHPEYTVYVVARLHELRHLQAADPRLGTAIRKSPQLLQDLLAVFVTGLAGEKRYFHATNEIYRHCLHSEEKIPVALTEFERAVNVLKLHFGTEGPYLQSGDRRWTGIFQLSNQERARYARYRNCLLQETTPETLKRNRLQISLDPKPVTPVRWNWTRKLAHRPRTQAPRVANLKRGMVGDKLQHKC